MAQTPSAGALRIAGVLAMAAWGVAGAAEPLVDLSRYESVQGRTGQDGTTAVVLALSGGGHRAAGFHAGVMLGLDELEGARVAGRRGSRSALSEVDYIVTISSGGCPVGGYLSALRDHLEGGRRAETFSFLGALTGDARGRQSSLADRLRGDQFSVLFGRGLLPEILPGGRNRGDSLERYLDEEICGGLQLGDVFVPRGAGRAPQLPYWIMCSTVDANGAIFCHTPDTYERYGIEAVRSRGGYRDVGDGAGEVACSLALKSSMAFPIFIPPTVMRSGRDPQRPFVQLRDGGISDNLGIHTGLELLRQEKRVGRRVMIVVDANCAATEPWQESTRRGGLVHHINDLCGLPLDARLHRYREILTSGGRRHEGGGCLVGGRTHDGIELHFVSPEVLSGETVARVKEIGTTLKLDAAEQALLLEAGRAAVHRILGEESANPPIGLTQSEMTIAPASRIPETALRMPEGESPIHLVGGARAGMSSARPEAERTSRRAGSSPPHRRRASVQSTNGGRRTLADFLGGARSREGN